MSDATPGPSAEQMDRLARWTKAYRQLAIGGLGSRAHTAGVERWAKDDEMPYLDVADVEMLLAEVERLARWKDEALPVLAGLQELGKALGLPVGAQITGPQAVEAVERLTAALAEAGAMFRDADVRLDEQRKMTERAEAQATKIADGLHVWREQCDRTEAVLAEMRGRIEALADKCACAMGECYCDTISALLREAE